MSINSICNVLKVRTRDIGNGPGIRVSVWVAGCSHHCDGCHNPETWKWKQGTPLTEELIQKILKACEAEYIAGLTLTGGDPMFLKNREGMTSLCKAFREKFKDTKSIWMWTGYLYEEIKDLDIFNYLNVIIDGKYEKSLKDVSLPYSGSKNQRVIKIKG